MSNNNIGPIIRYRAPGIIFSVQSVSPAPRVSPLIPIPGRQSSSQELPQDAAHRLTRSALRIVRQPGRTRLRYRT